MRAFWREIQTRRPGAEFLHWHHGGAGIRLGWIMAKQTFTIGRAGDIKLYDDTVSRHHACLEIEEGQLQLRDLRSRNGTYELQDKQLIPFTGGRIERGQVFAFGECVRSVTQLLEAVERMVQVALDPVRGNAAPPPQAPDAVLDGFDAKSRPRLSSVDIVALLDRIEDECEAGAELSSVLARLGITAERYGRWGQHFGRTRSERDQSVLGLRRENERLRKLVADLSLERDALAEALVRLKMPEPQRPVVVATPSISLVSDKKS
jgi:putative transposase